MAAKQHFNNFMIVVSGSRSEIKRLGVGGQWGEGGWLRGRRSKKREAESVYPRLNVFPLSFFPSPSNFLRHCSAVQMEVLIMHHMNLSINLLRALKVYFIHMFNKFHPPHYCVYGFFSIGKQETGNRSTWNTSTVSDCFQLEGEKRRWFR